MLRGFCLLQLSYIAIYAEAEIVVEIAHESGSVPDTAMFRVQSCREWLARDKKPVRQNADLNLLVEPPERKTVGPWPRKSLSLEKTHRRPFAEFTKSR